METYPRDLVGYGPTPPDPKWPNGARVAVQFVLNYEEGSEHSVLDGDDHAETFSELPVSSMGPGRRDPIIESLYEFGSRVGVWRVLNAFTERNLPLTVFGCALALERNPAVAKAIADAGSDVCCHGWRWIGHHSLKEDEEREIIRKSVESLRRTVGTRPLGWYCRYSPSENTRRLVVEEEGKGHTLGAHDRLPRPTWSCPTRSPTTISVFCPYRRSASPVTSFNISKMRSTFITEKATPIRE